MVVSIPDSLTSFIDRRVRSGGYPNADAFIADLLNSEASVMEGVGRGEPLARQSRSSEAISRSCRADVFGTCAYARNGLTAPTAGRQACGHSPLAGSRLQELLDCILSAP
jgi:Arc/MetJ-type ribon-helix-helix transcriptional regulator